MMETLTKLDQEVMRTLILARTKFSDRTFPEPKIKMDLTGKVAGMFCSRPTPLLRYNLTLLLKNKEVFLSNTVPHEVAHFVVHIIAPGSPPHGVVWRAIMELFGITNPQTYHDYKVLPLKRRKRPYLYQCKCSEHYFTKQRHNYAKKGRSYTCTKCKGILHYKGE
jgi:SprT protein